MNSHFRCEANVQEWRFQPYKFVSNSKDVIRRILESDKADGVKELDLDLDSLPLERALGV